MTEAPPPRRAEDLPTQAEMLQMTGLEFMQGMYDGTLPPPPIAGLMDYALDRVAEGRVIFRGAPGFDVLNPMGSVHGGWYGTLLDSAMGCAVMTMLSRGQAYTTLEYKINITRAVPVGTEVVADGWSLHGGRSTAVAAGEIRGVEDSKLYATGSTTCLVMQLG